jgi:octaprenyl-diphosphate synthase
LATELARVESILQQELAEYRPRFPTLIDHLQAYQGKRLRPALLLLTARACHRILPAHLSLAAVVEMIHTATLIHDDVLDQAQQRRGQPAIHIRWGPHAAILLGDLLFTHAFYLAARVDQRACQIIGAATNAVCAGELQQWAASGNWQLTEAEYLAIIDGKTAALTECATRLGALYAQAQPAVVAAAARYGRFLGRAFQIADDLLDLVGREETAGKTLGTDLAQAKATLPIIHARRHLTVDQWEKLCQLLQHADTQRYHILEILQRCGSLQYAQQRAEHALATARSALRAFPPSPDRDLLDNLTDWAIQRPR